MPAKYPFPHGGETPVESPKGWLRTFLKSGQIRCDSAGMLLRLDLAASAGFLSAHGHRYSGGIAEVLEWLAQASDDELEELK